MTSIAYLANQFPEPLEPYVWEEICELRRHDCWVMPCSFNRPQEPQPSLAEFSEETLYVFPLQLRPALRASWLCIRQFALIADLLWRAVRGPEVLSRRMRTVVHTWLGAYLATILRGKKITHIHIHHGYFSAWVGMVASRLLGAGFSMTLHGSDLLVRADYLDCKLKNCRFCVTISEFNRNYILRHYPAVDSNKILVHRLGVDLALWSPPKHEPKTHRFSILSVGRLHKIKNYGFLLLACRALKTQGVQFRCVIAGEGGERGRLQELIRELGLQEEVGLRGFVPRDRLPDLYLEADVVVLTSLSEGIPVTLMEAMAMERVVLAPAITGIPELISGGKTGFLYMPNSMEDFLAKLALIRIAGSSLRPLRQAARRQVELRFNGRRNLAAFTKDFLEHASGTEAATGTNKYADPVLQQIQLRIQRDRSLPV